MRAPWTLASLARRKRQLLQKSAVLDRPFGVLAYEERSDQDPIAVATIGSTLAKLTDGCGKAKRPRFGAPVASRHSTVQSFNEKHP